MPSIEDWLNDLGLGKYSKTFAANDVDFRVLPDLNSADLQELGVSLGHRKIMLAAIAALRKAKPQKTKIQTKQEQATSIAADPRPGPSTAEAVSEPGPDLRLLSVLFCDMVDSTSLSGEFNAEQMHDLISTYHETVADAVTRLAGLCGKVPWRRRTCLFRLAAGLRGSRRTRDPRRSCRDYRSRQP
jgi:class 3 adenylate cyclase